MFFISRDLLVEVALDSVLGSGLGYSPDMETGSTVPKPTGAHIFNREKDTAKDIGSHSMSRSGQRRPAPLEK